MSDVMSRLAVSVADRYRIERELGAGGMATGLSLGTPPYMSPGQRMGENAITGRGVSSSPRHWTGTPTARISPCA